MYLNPSLLFTLTVATRRSRGKMRARERSGQRKGCGVQSQRFLRPTHWGRYSNYQARARAEVVDATCMRKKWREIGGDGKRWNDAEDEHYWSRSNLWNCNFSLQFHRTRAIYLAARARRIILFPFSWIPFSRGHRHGVCGFNPRMFLKPTN